jgi:hypothetical protein
MNDVTFLQQCGIEIDSRWLVESMHQETPGEVANYVKSLIRIADMLGHSQIPCSHRLTE